MSKPTLATLKSFIKKNRATLLIKQKSRFDGMTDGIEQNRNAVFVPAQFEDIHVENTLGVRGVWVVRGSRDYITEFHSGDLEGYEVSNCCGSFIVAKKVY